jgi:serine phosphatase RsbU (regulator of sigma subunit)
MAAEVRDGMDGSIISYDITNKTLVYSGAYNPLYLIRDNKITLLNADRMPLSHHIKMSDFSSQEITTRQDDLIYLFTDGYMDQFGGPNLKKFSSAQFKEALLRQHKNSMEIQKQMLLDTYLNWRGNEDQVDDITVVGLKL